MVKRKRKYDNIHPRVFGQVVSEVIAGAKTATKYVDERTVVKATLVGKRDYQEDGLDVRLTFGAPNFREKQFIKDCKEAGEPFPVRKIQLRFAKGR
jgi:hypothetical protein